MEFPFISVIFRPLNFLYKSVVRIDDDMLPTIELVGESDKHNKVDMRVIRLTFKAKSRSYVIESITSKEKLYSAYDSLRTSFTHDFLFVGTDT